MSDSTKTVSFTLGEHDRGFIADMVEKGRFGNKTEVVRAGLRLLEDYENHQKLQRLKVEIAKGESDLEANRVTAFSDPAEMIENVLAETKTHKQ